MKNALNILVRKREKRRPFWRYKLEDNVKMNLNEVIMCESVDWIYVAQNSVHWWYVVNRSFQLHRRRAMY